MKIFKNYQQNYETVCKTLSETVKELVDARTENAKLRTENAKLRNECGDQAARIRMLEGVRKSQGAAIEKLEAELKVRSGEILTLKDLVERQGEDLQCARDTLRRVKNVLR